MNKLLITLVVLLTTDIAVAGDWDLSGFFSADSQVFFQDAHHQGQQDGANLSLAVQPEIYWRSDSGAQRISLVGFARGDLNDDERSHIDLREAYWGIEGSGWDLVLGINKVFWGVAESRHLVDVINQTDLIEDIDQEAKLGQPMLNVNFDRPYGRFEFFVLPGFRERTFPGIDGRFRLPLPIDTDRPIYESSAKDDHIDFALRYSHYVGDVDLGIHVFEGTSREPRFRLAPENDGFLPEYEQMTQVGVDLQYTTDAWLWKLEAIHRDTTRDSFAAAVAGFEYTLYGIRNSSADLGLLVEYLHDDRDSRSPPTAFNNDLFVGGRLALNDASNTSVLAGFVADLETSEMFVNVEAERRIGDNLNVSLRMRAFVNSGAGETLNAFANDDYMQFRVSWYY
jgi:hypothetical protein